MNAGAVIVGASHAGVQVAASLRQNGWQEPIHLLSADSELPYHRPPLSKGFLSGERSAEQLLLRGRQFYSDQGIELVTDCTVGRIDLTARRVESSMGEFDYARLILATGASARRLAVPGAALDGVLSLRDMADARHVKAALAAAHSVVIVGGGFIGLEVAATAVKSGKRVVVLEAQDRLLARALPQRLSGFLADYHARNGVVLRMNAAIEGFHGENGQVTAVRLADGTRLEADLVVVGIGSSANIELATNAGIPVMAGGIHVDAHGMTTLEGVYAAGDCASFHNRFWSGPVRVESVQNATDQARAVAGHCVDKAAPLTAVPWFWTDQYDLKIQMAGLMAPGCEALLRGEIETGTFSVLHLRDQRLVSAFSVNRPADHLAARKLIDQGLEMDLPAAADSAIPLARAVPKPS
ncbi:MAG TPA: FAD-dependent oxidoreductase [Ensifer sp.]|nr:FAD-dependent oxidoreductase [Ensifer sp.]